MKTYLLVINAGSSSIKFAVYQTQAQSGDLTVEFSGAVDGIGVQPLFGVKDSQGQPVWKQAVASAELQNHAQAIALIQAWLDGQGISDSLAAVGHRVVHGGKQYSEPTQVTEAILTELERLVPLAPLHQPHNLAAIRAIAQMNPDLPQVACFDTAFHRTQPVLAQQFALPMSFTDEGVLRYGFHGLSYEYIASSLSDFAPELVSARVVVAHLGNGASLCALKQGQSVATTMGFSPLDGLVMGSRCGNIDPGVLLYLMREHGMDADGLQQLLYYQSGLLGVSGISSDMRLLLDSDDPQAVLAVDLFVYRIVREIGSLIAALGGLDGLVFTGGIGENSAPIRAKIIQQLAWLGITLDEEANEQACDRISTIDSGVSAWVLPTDENLMIAQHVLQTVQSDGETD
jgi:acetate kinase